MIVVVGAARVRRFDGVCVCVCVVVVCTCVCVLGGLGRPIP
jgi:hypothetical protein